MSDVVEAVALFKKKKGVITIRDRLKWTEVGQTQPAIDISFDSIANLQTTPATSAKIMIRVFIVVKEGTEPKPLVFNFTNLPNGREHCDTITTELQKAVTRQRDVQQAGGSAPEGTKLRLEEDIDLQESLLTKNPELLQTFKEVVMKGHLTNEQFWSTRLHLLRAHAVEKAQQRGPYNVLATIKPKTVDNQLKVSLTRPQIHDMFDQHPLLKLVYDKHVPPLTEGEFWSRFFLSKLCKKLRGDRITAMDASDDIMDQYLKVDPLENKVTNDIAVSHVLDIEGNDQNANYVAQLVPDVTMRVDSSTVPLMRNINGLSQRLLQKSISKRVIDTENQYLEESSLHDLAEDVPKTQSLLKIEDQNRFFETGIAPKREEIQGSLPSLEEAKRIFPTGKFELYTVPRDDKALSEAAMNITIALRKKIEFRTQGAEPDLPKNVKDEMVMCHAATVEFLHQFWLAYYSEKDSKEEMSSLAQALQKTNARMGTVLKMAIDAGKDPNIVRQALSSTNESVKHALACYQSRLQNSG
ncbi:transcription factor TFIIH complex subunit Tfb1 [Schizosaccharomyces japonicus yFS275]|uniref:Transcription factor TFIIH complex subunit Tfb1 n=1 Tax=Schizosaccharomyces japonicus (strain yFS275 / FY16936) TaxID=402676 RepID=B6JVU6_SCHJY|nr:transcription factor TFIIH complex subunit Tfb1 [Schizosaccharomyces japonicus yFS275]EEB05497.2 transcription factor TFIIH complex subunit Tfb1 [Schizosaccharomyces japonicus yFS275]